MEKKEKILVIDDNRVMLTFIANLLEKEGHEVFTAHDGLLALKIIFREKPDILFIDLFMPKIGGDLLCRMVRKMPQMGGCYVVIISAALAEADIDYQEVGANAYIPKGPFAAMGKFILAAVKEAQKRSRDDDPKRFTDIMPEKELPLQSRQITRELISRNRHWETVLDSIGDGVLETVAQTIIYANEGALTLFGLAREDMIAASFFQLFHPADHRRLSALIAPATRGTADIPAHDPLVYGDRQLALRAYSTEGDIGSCIVVIMDVTRQNHIYFRRCHARKMHAARDLAEFACKSLRKQFQKILKGRDSGVDSDGGLPPPAPIQALELHSLYRQLSRIARTGEETPRDEEGGIRNGRETLLLVDSDTLLCGLNRKLLEDLGHTVLVAKTAGSALFKYRARCHKPYLHIDALIVNGRLPDMDLSDFVNRLLGLDPDARILVTAESPDAFREPETLTNRICGLLQTPLDPYEVSAALQSAFAPSEGGA